MAFFTTAIATLLAAIIGGGVSLYAGSKQNDAYESAQDEARRLAEIQRKDQLKINAENEKLSKAQLKLQKAQQRLQEKQFGFQKEEMLYQRGIGEKQMAEQKKQSQFSNSLSLINANDALRQRLVSVWRR